MGEDQNELVYFVAEKGPILVASFSGVISKTSAAVFQRCFGEIQKSQAAHIILSLHDVRELKMTGIPDFVRFQVALRKKPAQIRICFLPPNSRKLLRGKGAIRPEEVAGDLQDALESLGISG